VREAVARALGRMQHVAATRADVNRRARVDAAPGR
jgi:hypothetical protein